MNRVRHLQHALEREVSVLHSYDRRPVAERDKLAEQARIETSLAFGKNAFKAVLTTRCPTHDAYPNEPCHEFPRGVCGARIEATWPPQRPRNRYGRPAA